ncbi:MAG: hypothetical protein ACFE89_03415 [Candidatus Hodarchaeota archaeon]
MTRRKDEREKGQDPVTRDLMARSEGHKEWIDSYDVSRWGWDAVFWVFFIIITIVIPIPIGYFFGLVPFAITGLASWIASILGVYFLVRDIQQDQKKPA